MKFKAPSALSQQHLPVLVFLSLFPGQPLSELHPPCLWAHKNKEWTFTIPIAAELTEG